MVFALVRFTKRNETLFMGGGWGGHVRERQSFLCSLHYLLKALSLQEMDFPIPPPGIGICNCFRDDKVQVSSLNSICRTLMRSPFSDLKILSYHTDVSQLFLMYQKPQ